MTFEGDGVHPKRLHRNHQIEIRALNVTTPSGRHCQRKVARTEFSTDDRELGRPVLTPLGARGGAVELEIVP